MESPSQKRIIFLHNVARHSLSDKERAQLIASLQDYQENKSIEQFFKRLMITLKPVGKLDVLKDIRQIIYKKHLAKFDWMLNSVIRKQSVTTPHIINNNREHTASTLSNGHGRSRTAPVILNTKLGNPYNSSPNKVRTFRQLRENGNLTLPNKITTSSNGNIKFKIANFIQPDKFQNLGFSICGGKENRKGIFIGSIQPSSKAEEKGMKVGDALVEVNGISLEHIALQSALSLIKNLKQLKFVIKSDSSRFTDIFNLRGVNPWTNENHLVESTTNASFYLPQSGNSITHLSSPRFSSAGKILTPPPSQRDARSGPIPERKIELVVNKSHPSFLGFNIRGGSEYGIGIFVSSVDADSPADHCGLKSGDQILDVNGVSFERITNRDAISYIKKQHQLCVTVKHIGKIPEGRKLIHEYSWITADGERSFSRQGTHSRKRSEESLHSLISSTSNDVMCLPENVPICEDILSTYQTSPPVISNNESIGMQVSKNWTHKRTSSLDNNKVKCRNIDNHKITPDRRNSLPNGVFGDASIEKIPKKSSYNHLKNMNKRVKSSSLTDLSNLDTNHKKVLNKKMAGSLDNLNKRDAEKQSFFRKQGDRIKNALSWKKKKDKDKSNRDLFNCVLFDDPEARILYLDQKFRRIFTVNEYESIKQHLADYLDKGDVEIFLIHLLAAFDTPQKYELIPEVRNIIFPNELGRFDAIVAKHEIENVHKLNPEITVTPVIYDKHKKPPKKKFVSPMKSPKSGKFNSKTLEDKKEMESIFDNSGNEKFYHKSLSIIDQEITNENFGSLSRMPQPSLMYASMLQNGRPELLEQQVHSRERMNSSEFSSFLQDDSFEPKEKETSIKEDSNENNDNRSVTFDDKSNKIHDILPNVLEINEITEHNMPKRDRSYSVPVKNSPRYVKVKVEAADQQKRTYSQNNIKWNKNKNGSRSARVNKSEADLGELIFNDDDIPFDNPNELDEKVTDVPEDLYAVIKKVKKEDPSLNAQNIFCGGSGTEIPIAPVVADLGNHTDDEEAGDVMPEELNVVVKRVKKSDPKLKVRDSFCAYNVNLSSSLGDTNNNSSVAIENVNINKINKIYKFSKHSKKPVVVLHNTPNCATSKAEADQVSNVVNERRTHSLSNNEKDMVTSSEVDGNALHEIEVSKNFSSLGLSISGGCDSKKQPEIKIAVVHPETAASETDLKPNQILISIDGESVIDTTHKEAVDLIRMRYKDKSTPTMHVVVADR